jgi:hypothetical protein
MRFKKWLDSEAFFRTEDEVRLSIKKSKNYEGEDPSTAQYLIIFKTSKQRTYLVVTTKRLYCIIDDSRKDAPHINWSMEKSSLKDNGQIIINISERDKTEKTGLVDIGPKHKNWLFTKKLFEDKDIVSSIKDLILAM